MINHKTIVTLQSANIKKYEYRLDSGSEFKMDVYKIYNKQDAIMTKGLVILSMLVLHLFCRTGNDVYGC